VTLRKVLWLRIFLSWSRDRSNVLLPESCQHYQSTAASVFCGPDIIKGIHNARPSHVQSPEIHVIESLSSDLLEVYINRLHSIDTQDRKLESRRLDSYRVTMTDAPRAEATVAYTIAYVLLVLEIPG